MADDTNRKKLGGARAGSGRKREHPDGTRSVLARLHPEQLAEIAREIEDGARDNGAAVRKLIDRAAQCRREHGEDGA